MLKAFNELIEADVTHHISSNYINPSKALTAITVVTKGFRKYRKKRRQIIAVSVKHESNMAVNWQKDFSLVDSKKQHAARRSCSLHCTMGRRLLVHQTRSGMRWARESSLFYDSTRGCLPNGCGNV